MFEKIIQFSLKNKPIIWVLTCALIVWGIVSVKHIAIDAVPDITNNQVQIVTNAPTLAAEEIEKYITYIVERAVANIPDVQEVRSISRYGLSVVTVVFAENASVMTCRQHVAEQLSNLSDVIPASFGTPEMMPITTGLGEIYQYVLLVDSSFTHKYDATELRTIQDWIVKRQLQGLPGIVEVSSFGGHVKQYEVSLDPLRMMAHTVTTQEIADALHRNNENAGASYIDKEKVSFYLRTEGRMQHKADIENTLIRKGEYPLRVADVATVKVGSAKRFGAMTMDGKGEVVGGITLMLKGGNAYETVNLVKERMNIINKSLPDGIEIYSYLDRSVLVEKTIRTVSLNLLEGGAIVMLVLLLFLGNFRAGLIVSSIIPLSMLFGFGMMRIFNVSANLMSLGAIDFGIVVDGAVIIVEGIIYALFIKFKGQHIEKERFQSEIQNASIQIYKTAAFGILIILVVLFPVFFLQGIEGKTFVPMAQTVSFAILGSLLLSLTYVPVACTAFLNRRISAEHSFSEKMLEKWQKKYARLLGVVLKKPVRIVLVFLLLFVGSVALFVRMGAEFIPTLEEGDLAVQMNLPPGSSLRQSIESSTQAEKILLAEFPEVKHVVSKIGTAEIPTDPMGVEDTDMMILLKEKSEWKSAKNRNELTEKMKESLTVIPGVSFEFSQPIQLRFNELMTGAKTDIAVQIFGEDMNVLRQYAEKLAALAEKIPGAADVKVERTEGLRQLNIIADRQKLALHGIDIADVNVAIQAAYAGVVVGNIYEQERSFELVVRLSAPYIETLSLHSLFVRNHKDLLVPLSELVRVEEVEAPLQISRENASRKITLGINVRNRDVASVVNDLEKSVDKKIKWLPGYRVHYGGQFENLTHALERMQLLLPLALFLILFLLYLAFGSIRDCLIIFLAVPFASVGGVLALWVRNMPFSISAGIGFIALFGVAVLNSIVLINEIKQRTKNNSHSLIQNILQAASTRLRPVLMTASVASLGFLPMALATSNGAEVQRPLATVVIGGLITSTLLTLFVLPAIYYMVEKYSKISLPIIGTTILFLFLLNTSSMQAQQNALGLHELVQLSQQNNIAIKLIELEKRQWQSQGKASYVLAPMQAGIQYGQNDGIEKDIFWDVTQDIGSPWTIRMRKAMAEAGENWAAEKKELTAQELSYLIHAHYYNWVSRKQLHVTYSSFSVFTKEVHQHAGNMLKAGEISQLEFVLLSQLSTVLWQKMQVTYTDLTQLQAELLYLAGISQASLKDTILEALPYVPSALLRATFFKSYEAEWAHLKKKEQVMRWENAPALQVGYFNQTLQNVQGFQGFKAGLSAPLVFSGRKQQIVQNRLQMEGVNEQQQGMRMKLENELLAISSAISFYGEAINPELMSTWQVETALKQLKEKWQSGEINHIEFIRILTLLYEGSTAGIDMINQYNQAVLKHRFLTSGFN